MIEHKKWNGSYRYNKEKHQNAIGSEQTIFEIELTSDGTNDFVDKIIDDPATGGTSGIGEITGNISGDKVEFVKTIPVLAVLRNKQLIPIQKRKHCDVFYTGIVSADRKSMSGKWKIKCGLGLLRMLPLIFLPTSGTWEMNAVD